MERKALEMKADRSVETPQKYWVVVDVWTKYESRLNKLESAYYDVFELLKDSKLYRKKAKVLYDFVDLKRKADKVFLNNEEINELTVKGFDAIKLGIKMQNSIKECKGVCDDLIHFYKTFSKISSN